jgi:Protein of unknown function (DUF2997)
MTMETLEFIIYPDGRVQETVTGIAGSSCTKVTAEIEAALGRVVSNTPTAEFFEQENNQAVTVNHANFATW